MPVEDRVTLEGVRPIFKNFQGKKGKYNNEGDRSFSIILEPDIAEAMLKDGWSVRQLRSREEDIPGDWCLEIAVSYKNRPPTAVMITSRGRTSLSEDEIGILDDVDIKDNKVDLIINPYNWAITDKHGGTESGTKAYLKSIYVIINEDELELKYADLENLTNLPTRSGRVDDGD